MSKSIAAVYESLLSEVPVEDSRSCRDLQGDRVDWRLSEPVVITTRDASRITCCLLLGEVIDWVEPSDTERIRHFLDFGRHHGVLPLLDAAFRSREGLSNWPERLRQPCRQASLAQSAYELAHGGEIDDVLAALTRVDVRPLLLKGTGLAYSLYPSPALRPRSDTDLLVPPELRATALRVLEELGYRRTGGPAGRYVGYQQQMQRVDARGVIHNIDLHWRLSDVQTFAWLFDFADLDSAALPVPALNPSARRLGNAHALLHCLLHRAGNNQYAAPGFGDRLIWLYDMHLLVTAMSRAELDAFREMVEGNSLGAIALDGLQRCAASFTSPKLSALIETMERSPGVRAGLAFLGAGRLRREWIELRAVPGVAARLAYLGARVLPAAEYMRERYPDLPGWPVGLLHVRRWVAGVGRLVGLR